MIRHRIRLGLMAALVCGAGLLAQAQVAYRTLNDTFDPPKPASLEAWQERSAWLKEHILASAGLLPLPERTPLNPVIAGEQARADYMVSTVYFESLPGFFVTGNLYRPPASATGPFPAILSPHGHWAYGRLEHSDVASVPTRAVNLARQGFVVFTYDMIGYNDSRQLAHTFGGRRENLWGLSLAGLHLWNSIRALDFLESLDYVRRDAIGATGASGGGTQTFLLAAVDERVAAAAPVNMISLHMQGGCLCENQPGLRLDTTNVEIAATIAPRPLLMVSATGDWTKNTLEQEYPAVKRIYALHGAEDRVHGVRYEAPHNYNRASREAMYAWMARWLQREPADVRRPERSVTPDPLPEVLVFHQRALPASALGPAQLTDNWVAAARRQLSTAPPDVLQRALAHALGVAPAAAAPAPSGRPGREVLLATPDAELERLLTRAGFKVHAIAAAPFDRAAAEKIRHFETYNRTAAGQRVAEIVAAARARPGAALVAGGDDALAGLLAAAVAPLRVAVLDVGDFDPSDDAAFVQRLYIPGIRRAGDLRTAARQAGDTLVLHNAGARFMLEGARADRTRLTPQAIVELVRARMR